MADDPTWTAETALGDWLLPRLSPWGEGAGTPVTSLVPRGYEAHARVVHPVEEDDDGVPEVGTLTPSALAAVVDVLSRWTAVDDCVMAVWEGFGWVSGQGTALVGTGGTARPGPAYPPHVLDGPRLQHPGRAHLLFTGPLASSQHLGQRTPDAVRDLWPQEWLWRQSPNLLWPRDLSWCLATEVDLDSTVVGGPAGLVEALCAAPRLEAHAVDPSTDLSGAGDEVDPSA